MTVALYATALFGSFFTTLWLTNPEGADARLTAADHRPDAQRFAGQLVSNKAELAKAARNLGLRLSPRLKGAVAPLSRVNEREVKADGWLADPQGTGAPINVFIFAGGTLVATTQTKGERPDVTQAMHLDLGAEKNVNFSLIFNCKPGDEPIIVGTAENRQYIPIESGKCS